jgi:Zn finger protein HypA/HybF involved in hydrogenase expression
MVQGYCMKCKAKQEIKDAKQDKMANGRDCVKGSCPTCGTKMFKIGKM